MEVQCVRCGKVFDRPNWHATREQKHYCSKECRFPTTVITCVWCGQQKRVPPSAVKEHNFCSRKCCRAWQGANGMVGQVHARIDLVCPVCGKAFYRERNAVNRANQNYCSQECYHLARQETMTGASNPAWRGGGQAYYGPNWRRQSRRARARDRHMCQRCGVSENEIRCALHVHHVIPLRTFQGDFSRANALKNLVSLCPVCHKTIEWHPEQMEQFLNSMSAGRSAPP